MDGWRIDGNRLRNRREHAEITVYQIADLLGCHPNHYRKWEAGTAQPSAVRAHQLVRILSKAAGRRVVFADIADAVPRRRKHPTRRTPPPLSGSGAGADVA